jgi:hypothetical protein
MEKIINKINSYGDSLSPDYTTEEKIWNVVNSKLSQSQAGKYNLNLNRFMKNTLKYSLLVFVICFVVAVPVYFIGQANSKSDQYLTGNPELSSDMQVGNSTSATAPESSVSSGLYMAADQKSTGVSEFFDNIMPYQNETTDNTTSESERAKDVDATLTYKVIDVWKSVDQVNQIMKEFDAYSTYVSTSTTHATYVIKVPVDKFNDMHIKLRELASVIDSESIKTVDMQNQVYGLEQSISVQEDLIADLKSQLANTTDNAKKIELQQQIKNAEALKSSYDENLQSVLKTTDVSTIYLELRQDNSSTSETLLDSLKSTWTSIQGIFIVWVKIVLYAVLILIAISPIAIPVYLLVRKTNKSK